MMIRVSSTRLYQNLAANRRLLLSADGEELTTADLREMLAKSLEACELLSLALDECQDVLERLIVAPRNAPGTPR